jgi:hypothetical protein
MPSKIGVIFDDQRALGPRSEEAFGENTIPAAPRAVRIYALVIAMEPLSSPQTP